MSWSYVYDNAPLSEIMQAKMQCFGLLPKIPDTNIPGATETQFVKDFFTADGYPKLADGAKHADVAYPYIYPAIAPWYDGAAVPAAILEMDPKYRQTACEAAMSWLFNLTGAAEAHGPNADSYRSFHGLAFTETIYGTDHLFAFPDTRIYTTTHGVSAVILIADSYMNNEEWDKQCSVPLYAHQQAMFQLWCWQKFAEKCNYEVEAPISAFIVRICGNLAADCTIRTVLYNPAEATALVNRICKARTLEPQRGLYWKRNVETPLGWMEKLNTEAFQTDNEDLYELVKTYMKARSDRKQIERELKEVTNRMDAISVALASRIPAGQMQCECTLPDGSIIYVTHQRKYTRSKKLSPNLVRSFFPALDECIHESGIRKTVTIEAL